MTATLSVPGGSTTARGSMRTALVEGPAEARIAERALREPGRGEVRIAVRGCGVCASSLPVWEGRPWFAYPLEPGAPGHEGWGVVDAVGDDVESVAVGARVACLTQRAFASHDYAAANEIVELRGVPDGTPFPGEAFGCAMNIARASRIRPGDVVAVIGIGFLGAVLVRLASEAGARVLAISRRRWSLELAMTLGAAEAIPLDDHARVVDRVRSLRPDGVDISIEATGAQWPLDLAAEITREEGRLVIAGYHQDGARTVNLQHWNWRAFDIVNAHRRDPRAYIGGMRRAVDAVATGTLDPRQFITHSLRLGELSTAFALLRERPDGFLKAVVVP